MKLSGSAFGTVASLLFACGAAATQPGFFPVGDLPGGSFGSTAFGVSESGLVVGSSNTALGTRPVVWSSGGGIVELNGSIGQTSALAISQDGSVIVGGMNGAAFQWTATTEFYPMLMSATPSTANAVSANGRVIVGHLFGRGFRWEGAAPNTGTVIEIAPDTVAHGVSADGAVTVGEGTHNTNNEAFRWTSTGGLTWLGDAPGGQFLSCAYAANSDGSTIVGCASWGDHSEAARWRAQTGWESLGDLPGGAVWGWATAVSSDGTRIIGRSETATGWQGFIWIEGVGMRNLRDYLASLGTDLTGWKLTDPQAMTGDGRIIVGYGINPCGNTEGWVVRFDQASPCRADFDGKNGVTIDDLFRFLDAWFRQHPRADQNGLNCVTIDDLFLFLNAWFTGCP